MKVAVAGGTGTLGKLVVAELARRGDQVLALSRTQPRRLPDGASHRRIDLTDGTGLDEALAGVDAIVGVANTQSQFNAGPVLVEGTERLLRAGAAAGVGHFVGISIVGCDRVSIPYYKVKVAEEETISAGDLPWSMLRATQFHDLLAWAFAQVARAGLRPVGGARLQPVDAAVVASRLADAAHADPGGRLPEVAGPEVRTLSELAKAWRDSQRRHLLPLPIPMIGPIGKPLREGALCNPDAAAGGATFEQWLADG